MIERGFKQAIELILSGGNEELIDIVLRTAKLCLYSSLISLLLAIPLGILLGYFNFKGKHIITVINNTLTGVPPVVCGLICYMLFVPVGALGGLKFFHNIKGMVVAQIILITPVLIATISTFVSSIATSIQETTKGLKLGFVKTMLLTINETKFQLITTYLLGFSRSIAEVGAVSMIGGAIVWKSDVMTTAIMRYTNMGMFSYGIALGIILIFLSLIFNIIVYIIQMRFKYDSK